MWSLVEFGGFSIVFLLFLLVLVFVVSVSQILKMSDHGYPTCGHTGLLDSKKHPIGNPVTGGKSPPTKLRTLILWVVSQLTKLVSSFCRCQKDLKFSG